MLLQEDLVQMVPMISETNAMAEELDKKVSYSDKNCYLLRKEIKDAFHLRCILDK